MGREIRRVAVGWEHPRDADGDFIPLHDGWPWGYPLSAWQADWDEQAALWARGEHPDQKKYPAETAKHAHFAAWHGEREDAADHAPELSPAEREAAGWCYYENTTEGTPLSPVFATAEELAAWLNRQHRSGTWTPDEVRDLVAPNRHVYPGYWKKEE